MHETTLLNPNLAELVHRVYAATCSHVQKGH